MKVTLILAALVAAVAAQDLAALAAEIPACAKPALDEAAAAVGCSSTDYACQCGDKKQEITIKASPKVIEACGTEAQQVLAASNALCEAAANAPAQESSSAAATTSAAEESASSSAIQTSASGAIASASSEFAAKTSEIASKATSALDKATSAAGSAAGAATSPVVGSGANNAVNMGAMLGVAGVVAAMI